MRVTTMSPIVGGLAALTLIAACSESVGPLPNNPTERAGSLTVVPRFATIKAGQVALLKADLRDQFGDRLDVAFAWKTSDDAIATVSSTGEVMGRQAGYAVITASAIGESQTSTVRVLSRDSKGGGKPSKDPAKIQ